MRQDSHAAIATEPTIALRIARLAHSSVLVKVMGRHHAGVGRGRKIMVITGTLRENIKRHQVDIVVKIREEQDVRADRVHNAKNGVNLRIIAVQIPQQQPRSIAA